MSLLPTFSRWSYLSIILGIIFPRPSFIAALVTRCVDLGPHHVPTIDLFSASLHRMARVLISMEIVFVPQFGQKTVDVTRRINEPAYDLPSVINAERHS